MKDLQNNYTTPNQSKRLLELGVPADSADCYYYDWAWIGGEYYGASIQICSFSFRHEKILHERQIYPCWSVGRMIDIYCICNDSDITITPLNGNIIDFMISAFEISIDLNDIDFSKLEE